MLENEAVFRQKNERVQANFDEITEIAADSGQEYLVRNDDTALHFYCECSDENCRRRIQIRPSQYDKIHENRNRFVLIAGHETKAVERIVRRTPAYYIVEKYQTPPEKVSGLQPTGADNA